MFGSSASGTTPLTAAAGHPSEQTPPDDDTHARVLRVALELFAEKGFAATSTREISERLGFTKAALYYHFRTKDDLLAALVAPAFAGLERLVERTELRSSPAARRAILSTYVDLVADNADVIRVLTQDPSVAARPFFKEHRPIFERLVPLLAGEEEPDAAQRARVRVALGGIGTALLRGRPDDDGDIVREAAFAAACGALGIPGPRVERPATR